MSDSTSTGLLVSQIGYDAGGPVTAILRSDHESTFSTNTPLEVRGSGPKTRASRHEPVYWGTAWGIHWWRIDLSGLAPGEYHLRIQSADQEQAFQETIDIAPDRLWKETVIPVALEQLEERIRWARMGRGWKDCGAILREANSHAATVIGLCELAHFSFESLSREDYQRLIRQICHGCDYLGACQDKATQLGLPEGSLVHDLNLAPHLVPADAAQATVALAYASRIIEDNEPARAGKYIRRARLLYRFLKDNPYSTDGSGFSALNHGAPEGFTPPPEELMTRELLMRAWAAVELWISGGREDYKEDAVTFIREVMDRQVPESAAESGFYGHFRTFRSASFTEKANIHHHMGYDTGGIFPHFLLPVFEMISRWPDHPEVPEWQACLKNFAYGYLLPACRSNPFRLLPSGIFGEEGLLTFCGPWHGINASYAWIAVIASLFELQFRDPGFREIAVGNLQWIAGLNTGLTRDSFASSEQWQPQLPTGVALSYSMIEGVGRRHTHVWSRIRGSIPNGFSANPQFHLTVQSTRENDRPAHFTDEDWIPHGAAWVAALARYRQTRYFLDGRSR
jgi:hypothetical protein